MFAEKKPKKTPAMKRVAGSGRIATTARRRKTTPLDELPFAIDYCTRRAHRHAHDRATKTIVPPDQRFAFVSNASNATWKLFRTDHDVDQRQQLRQTFINVVDVCRSDRARLFCGFGDAHTRGRIVRIEMQHTSQRTKLNWRIFRSVSQAIVAVPNDRAFTAAPVDRDERTIVSRSFHDFSELDVHTVSFQRVEAKLTFRIRSETSGIRRFQPQPPQSDHGRCRLAAG